MNKLLLHFLLLLAIGGTLFTVACSSVGLETPGPNERFAKVDLFFDS